MINQSDLEIFADAEVLAKTVTRRIKLACELAVEARGAFHLVLAGGTTPKRCYELLAEEDLAWDKLHIYFGDERCLSIGDLERNDTMAKNAWLDKVSIPDSQIHSIPAEEGPDAGAERYSVVLENAPSLDLVLLGLGEDGHTASLFPGNTACQDTRYAVPVFNAPKPPPERISMGQTYINQARSQWFIVTGSGKHDAIEQIMHGEPLPATMFKRAQWLVEEASMPV